MANLETQYLGLTLRNPIIAGSSGMSLKMDNLLEMEKNGVGAIVLKSLFEEQIRFEFKKQMVDTANNINYPEAEDYIKQYTEQNEVEKYLNFIREAKKQISVPIIASINCYSATDWVEFAKKIEDAGADALELNIFLLPSDENTNAASIEEQYSNIIDRVLENTSLPVAVKLGNYFTDLSRFMVQLSWKKIKGMVLFNRPFSPDININELKITATNMFSNKEEISTSLRWIAMLSGKVHADLCASTGIHDGAGVVKQLLAGANAIQVASVLYQKGIGEIKNMLVFVEDWMNKNNYKTIDEFRGKMSYKTSTNPAAYERVQFMKYYSGIE
ncbi:MAG: diguanylate cyclase [Bacteroidetes bacterium HGW-Bacteroidetes-6]|jgi:dihydroorotate dehydrogenase (fumarate)|nr:MAG: diguanylate cyclase [Bacteroidetes bacterium HGW-Bacteroidetes-6]